MIYTNDDDTGIIKTSGAMSLPGDILLNIDNYLWPEDRYACLLFADNGILPSLLDFILVLLFELHTSVNNFVMHSK